MMYTYKDLVERSEKFFIEKDERFNESMYKLIFQNFHGAPRELIFYITPEEYEQPIGFDALINLFEEVYDKGRITGVLC